MSYTWTSHTFMIADKAFKNIRPLSIELIEETQEYWDGYLWWRKQWTEKTGRWFLKLAYDRGPVTSKQVDYIYFDKESTARSWYTTVYHQSFMATQSNQPPAPIPNKPKTSNKPKGLKLVPPSV